MLLINGWPINDRPKSKNPYLDPWIMAGQFAMEKLTALIWIVHLLKTSRCRQCRDMIIIIMMSENVIVETSNDEEDKEDEIDI